MRTFVVAGVLLALLQIAAAENLNRAAYFLDNNPYGNSIVSLKIGAKDGRLSSPVRTSTYGKGLLGLTGPGVSAGLDALFSQDAVVVKDNYLFAVNPGSNTLSMFRIPKAKPCYPVLVGKPAYTMGEFPVSVTYSSKLKIACVLNGGKLNGVACFFVHRSKGLIPVDKYARSISFALNTTTPPVGPLATASDILFNPSSTALFVIVKGTPLSTPPTPGAIIVFPVVNGYVSRKPVVSSPKDIMLGFGSAFLGNDDRLIISVPSFGAEIVDVKPSFKVVKEPKKHVVIPNQAASCWAVYSKQFDSAFIMDAGRHNITILSPESGAIKGYINFDPSAGGCFDAAVDRTWLYAMARDASVLVFDVSYSKFGKGWQVQKLDLSSLGSRQGWQGMAIYPSWY